jgi:copper(I)-binding protein
MRKWLSLVLVSACAVAAAGAHAQVEVSEPWVRGTVPGQKSTGAFMKLTSPAGARLLEIRSPAAGVVEIHEMAMQGDVMRMRAVDGIDLPAGKTVELKAGSYHVMLLDLKKPLTAGDSVPLTLVVQDKSGVRKSIEIKAAVRALAPATPNAKP